MIPTADHVIAAAERLTGITARTPLIAAPSLGADVHLKCENLQRTGSFKLRGAYNALAVLTPEQRARGIVASSAGNHGRGVSHAARLLGMRALVFVPSTIPEVKRQGILAEGAEIEASQPDYDSAQAAAMAFASERGMTFVHPCAGAPLLAGQGTVALEILEQLPEVRTLVVCVGGGGLVGGIGAFVRARAPHVRIIGAQSELTNAMAASLAAGRRVEVPVPPTLADGLAGQIDDDGFAYGRFALDEIVTVSESVIADAIRWAHREHELRVEGSGAVGIAALLSGVVHVDGPTVITVSGGNIDDEKWRGIVEE